MLIPPEKLLGSSLDAGTEDFEDPFGDLADLEDLLADLEDLGVLEDFTPLLAFEDFGDMDPVGAYEAAVVVVGEMDTVGAYEGAILQNL